MKLADHLLLENEAFVAINKPAGVLTIPDRAGKEPSLKAKAERPKSKAAAVPGSAQALGD